MKKKIILIGAGLVVMVTALAFLIFASILAALIGSTSVTDAQEIEEPIPCTITGTKKKEDLDLILTYDGLKIKGITGTVSKSGSFSASTKESGKGQTKMALPKSGAKLDVQTFMCYTAVTAAGSSQYKLLNSSSAKDEGIYRKVNGRYAVALGSYYGSKIGTSYTLHFQQSDGKSKTIQAVLGDQKADKDTDAKHQYHTVDGSVVEFITASGTSSNVSATQKQINKDFGTLTAIYRSGGGSVELKGTIKNTDLTVEGTVDGIPLSANGTLKDGTIHAEGFIGENAEGAGGGIYTGGKFAWPVPGHTQISSEYGYRNCPFHGQELHSGLDIPAPFGTKVLAAANGTVTLSSSYGSYGNAVMISHGSALYTLYGHNSSLLVKKGDRVKKGQPVALVGSTGNSTGNHCHFEVRKGGSEHRNNTSPWPYLKK